MIDYSKLNPDLVGYVSEFIIPEYKLNDAAHGIPHVLYVIERSLRFAEQESLDLNAMFAIAAYHDCKCHVDRENHEVLSAMAFYGDAHIRRILIFDAQTSALRSDLAKAIEDHRASLGCRPRNKYGEVLSTADRSTNVPDTMRRMYDYRRGNYGETLTAEELDSIIDLSYKHAVDKFGKDGYARDTNYVNDPDYADFLESMGYLTDHFTRFKQNFLIANQENLQGMNIKEG